MQKRTSPLKFGDLAEKSGLNSVSNLSTKDSNSENYVALGLSYEQICSPCGKGFNAIGIAMTEFQMELMEAAMEGDHDGHDHEHRARSLSVSRAVYSIPRGLAGEAEACSTGCRSFSQNICTFILLWSGGEPKY